MYSRLRWRMAMLLFLTIVPPLLLAIFVLVTPPVEAASGSPIQTWFGRLSSTNSIILATNSLTKTRFNEISQPIVSTIASTQTSSVDLHGIYVENNEISHASPTALSALATSLDVPGVDGFVLVIGWDAIEPSMGQYQWATLDQWMSKAVSADKKIDLSVTAGKNTPSWLFQPAPDGAAATPLSFSIPRENGPDVCFTETIAAPWDAAFLIQWDSMLAALASHLKSVGTYDAVTLLRLTGVNRNSDELYLPHDTPKSTRLTCVSDAIVTWQQADYRPSLLLQGWNAITSSFLKWFPDKSFSVAIIAANDAFPSIAENGSVIKDTPYEQNLPLLTLASQKFPGKLVIQNNSLYPGIPAQAGTIQSAQSLGTMIAFQTNENLSATAQGASCGAKSDITPCTAATYLAELETGIYPLGKSNSLHAQYIEVFAPNVNAFPDVIQQAHQELLVQP